ncbi:hypothetical protein D0869_01231 [Hortaea werneckii]|uniref:tetrahydrofolate synthase n=1 Tax=Hortaea werneckii TaxID=91943 RepID=A0A3M6XDN0_HORWE|nr:hypothetical protein D0869_01231 [Hortaea werneckii]RMY14633.1 hypothetical protein D0868_01346 [Hortaea werneckii]
MQRVRPWNQSYLFSSLTLPWRASQGRHSRAYRSAAHSDWMGRMENRNYETAIDIIEGRKRVRRPNAASLHDATDEQVPKSSGRPDLRGTPSIAGMSDWLQAIGHSVEDINNLNVIHVAGTKGKGSTCAFTESFLRTHGNRTGYPKKTGLYTSPHLMTPEERVRVNMQPLERGLLAKYFFELYDSLPQLHSDYDPSKELIQRGPRTLQLWALLAFHVFIREGVDVAIIETHHGGEYDATNIIQKPVVTAITALGMDHIAQLGPTIENIAWHKSGIFKRGAVALSARQDQSLEEVLQKRSAEHDQDVRFVDEDERLPKVALKLEPQVQRKNASLALAAADTFLHHTAPQGCSDLSPADIETGVAQWTWPGRFQVVTQERSTWFLDAAHNDMSIALAAEWFAEAGKKIDYGGAEPLRILIFAHINELRDAEQLLDNLAQALLKHEVSMDHVIFTTYEEQEEGDDHAGDWSCANLAALSKVWQGSKANGHVMEATNIPKALSHAHDLAANGAAAQILVTGSQHLVGPSLRILQS